ncbi:MULTISPECIES: hypothetical protein [unclassified Microbacterium]|nr:MULTISPECIES: hypothetical protein [unclassified Microbacterium]MCR2784421.1 hypothetical protein [Microbacterium sp. zg.B96]MDL5350670.1 hypothetical protein [Microbacterium sp. zg-YB36]WIM14763.1 hypothetical protein QNO11_09310 [Microbacterium sp. zg-B96]
MTTTNPSTTQPLQPVSDDKNLLAPAQESTCACGGNGGGCGGN